ncbi:MAG TPA: acetate--CoA ligase [Chloroflexota bacterium]
MPTTLTQYQIIHKTPGTARVSPNLLDYERVRAAFDWQSEASALSCHGEVTDLNLARVAVDRHARGARRDRVAIRWLGRHGQQRDLTYADLAELSGRFANVLTGLGIGAGETVAALLGRVPDLYVAALGSWKQRAVFNPLFAAFGPDPIRQRLQRGNAHVLLTTEALYRTKVARLRESLPDLRQVLLIDSAQHTQVPPGTRDLGALLNEASSAFDIAPTDAQDPALLHFTSGTTGMPKGALHVHGAVAAHYATAKFALDLHPDDVFWCTADPGWVTGTSYGIIAPLVHGLTSIVDEADFDAERWYQILQDQHVSVWYTAPTAIRMLMRAGAELAHRYDLHNLRFIASVGEPLNPEAVVWGQEAFGLPIHDNWWQTETGGIMIANYAAMDIKPGSMGRPLPGVTAAIVQRLDRSGRPTTDADETVACEEIEAPNVTGELALRPGWPSMFRGYLGEPARYAKCFKSGWYLSGDLARRDPDGYYWFVGRGDDVIKTSGHLVGPFEVESALMEHPSVAEAGVIGKPDPVAGEIVKAFVLLKAGRQPSDDLRLELLGFGRQRLGAAVAPKEIVFAETLPHTRSGKIMRRLLKARELGLPEGDISTLEQGR